MLNGLRALAAAGPLLVAIDDLQWLDPPSVEALGFAARRLDGAPVRFLLSRRPRRVWPVERALGRGAFAGSTSARSTSTRRAGCSPGGSG